MKVKPRARRNSSTSPMRAGSTMSAPLSRKYSVSRTASACSSRRSWASSSSPVASGTRRAPGLRHVDRRADRVDDLLGALGVVALAPAEVGLLLDHLAQLEDPVHQRLGARRAARDVDVDRHELVGRHDRVVVEDAHRARARAHGDRPLGLEHLVVDAPDDGRHLDRDAPGEDEQVGLARRGAEGLEAEAGDVDARGDEAHHLDRAAGQAEGRGEQRVAARPVERPVERRGEHALLDVGVEVGALEVALERVAGAHAAGPEVGGVAAGGLADYLQFSAPRRHTYTNATTSSPMKTIVSVMAKVPNARSSTAIGYRKTTSMSNRMKSIATM